MQAKKVWKMNSSLPPDHLERERALDTSQSWIVEAPAGSGKTGLLIQRYLKLLASPDIEQPEHVLAITFTRKATAEMKERILEALRDAQINQPSDSPFQSTTLELSTQVLRRSNELGWHLFSQPYRLNIRTIDSVCGEIARSLPLLSGSAATATPIDDAFPFYRQAAQRVVMQLGGADQELHSSLELLLLHRDANLRDVVQLIAEMLATREQWGKLVPLSQEHLTDAFLDTHVLSQLQLVLGSVISARLRRLISLFSFEQHQELTRLASIFASAPGYKSAENPLRIREGMRLLSASPSDIERWRAALTLLVTHKGGWRARQSDADYKVSTTKVQKSDLKDFTDSLRSSDDLLPAIASVRSLPSAVYPQEQWVVVKALFRVLQRALVELHLLFAETQTCDFSQMSLEARGVLSGETGLSEFATSIGYSTRHLLVDEMQDTSSSQYELLHQLTRGWDGYSQTLFLVGDPKQSIYLFRQARVESFIDTMQFEIFGDIPVSLLQLSANFRSQPALVEDFNTSFSLIFPAGVGEIEYTTAFAQRPIQELGGIAWHIHQSTQ